MGKLKNLVEYTIGKVSKEINVKIEIDKSMHAAERQKYRDYITDDQIIASVNLALPQIADMLIFDKIDMYGHVLIKTEDFINIVGQLKPGENNTIDFIVITVMKKENFIPKHGTKVIYI